MAVFPVKKYKIVKDENGNKVQVLKSKNEWNKETKNGTATWYFVNRYKVNNKVKQYKSALFALKREAETDDALFRLDPIKYISEHSKRAKISQDAKDINYSSSENTLDSYFSNFEKDAIIYRAESTVYAYKLKYYNYISPTLGKMNPQDIDFVEINKFHMDLEKLDLSHNTKCQIHSTLSEYLEYLKKIGIITINYAKVVGNFKLSVEEKSNKKEKRLLYQTEEEFNHFIDIVDDPFWKTFFNFLFWHGLRRGEQQALKWKDINFEENTVFIHRTISKDINGSSKETATKNYVKRKIYLASQSKDLMYQLYQFCQNLDGFNDNWYVFGSDTYISKNMIWRKLAYYYKILKQQYPNVNELTHHQFGRHSHATYLLNIGMDRPDIYRIIALRLGDTEEVIRDTYAHPDEDINNDKIKELLERNCYVNVT